MASSSSPPSRQTRTRATRSTCTTEKAEGFHRFEIRNYSLVKALSTGNFARSGTFPVGGYDWSLLFYPSGCLYVTKGSASVYLQLMTSGATASATFLVRIINPASGLSRLKGHTGIGLYSSKQKTSGKDDDDKLGFRLMTTAELEATYVDRDSDRLVLECTVSVFGEPRASATTRLGIPLPPSSDLPAHLGRLLESQELADVTFDVRGQSFAAHRLVLAMRSPVFKASLFGPMSEGGGCITIQDVDPSVFKVLLDVIYTDSFPAMDDLDDDASRDLARHRLLAAADRYGMDRLKAQCESILSTSLNAHTVASTLALADLHGCHKLKDACVEFIISLGMQNGSVAGSEDDRQDQQLSCFKFLGCFSEAICNILRIH